MDIDEGTFNIDHKQIENCITDKTSAILLYGNPCNVEKIAEIAKKCDLKVIYDAAHCFGVEYGNRSILTYGDISTMSFHATKVFITIEGGAIVTKDPEIYERIKLLRNFGIKSEEEVILPGINCKR